MKQSARPDRGPEERWNHSGRTYRLAQTRGALVACVEESHILDTLHERRLINAKERDAGYRLKADYMAAGVAQRVTSSYNPTRGHYDPFHERSDEQEEAYDRWRAAVKSMGLRLNGPVVSAVCYEQTPRSVYDVKMGLAALAEHYGYTQKITS